MLDFEPVSDCVKKQFEAYREIRARVIEAYAKSSAKRAELANRYRLETVLMPGQQVAYRDPRAKAAGGRTAWRKPPP